jgi:uncharacterized protein
MHAVEVSFYSGPGYRLHGVLYTPEDCPAGARLPAVVLCLGFRPVLGMFAPRYAAELVPHGYAVLTFEYRGFGRSEGPRWRPIASEQLEDLSNAVSFMATRDEIDPDRIAVWGDASYGGAHGIMLAATDHRVRCLVVASPFADGEKLLHSTRAEWEWQAFLTRVARDRAQRVLTGQSELVRPETIMEFEPSAHETAATAAQLHPELAELMYPLAETADSIISYRPIDHIHAIAPRGVLIIHAAADLTLPADHAQQLYDRAGSPKKLALLVNATHYDVHARLLAETVELGVAWLQTHLRDRSGDVVLETEQ